MKCLLWQMLYKLAPYAGSPPGKNRVSQGERPQELLLGQNDRFYPSLSLLLGARGEA